MTRFIECLLFTLVLISCGTDSDHFKIEGRFRNLNQGEFYIYSPDGGISKLDTVKVQDGEFAFETPLQKKATFIMVFPNFSEQAIFGEPGKTAKVSGDASHLKEMEVSGNEDNKLMTDFRKSTLNNSDDQIRSNIANFVKDHSESIVGIYLVSKYFIRTANPNYNKALKLLEILANNQKDNGYLINLKDNIFSLTKTSGSKLPTFSAFSTSGNRISNSSINSEVTVINVWASWNNESMGIQRQLQSLKRQYKGKLGLIGINIDASKKLCTDAMRNDSIKWDNVCDEQMWDSPVLKALGIGGIPDNIIIGRGGKIIARSLNGGDLENKLRTILK